MEEKKTDNRTTALRGIQRAVLFALFALCVVTVILFSIPSLMPFAEGSAERKLFTDVVPRLVLTAFLVAVLFFGGYRDTLTVPKGEFLRGLLWSVPCFLVALANFPYSALATGSATIERVDLLWLFLLKCLSVALMEELFFRALLVTFVRERVKGKLAAGWTVLISSAVFALSHLFNLFFGAGVGATFGQVGYTFLLGCMFAVAFLQTKNIWLCVGVHFLFDVGGVIVTDLGSGAFQDTIFWILTVVTAIVCAAEVIYTIFKIMAKENDQKNGEK